MHTIDISAVQQRTKKLQKMISEVTLNDATLQAAFVHQVYDSNSRNLTFLKVLERQHSAVSQTSTRSSLDLAGRLKSSMLMHSPKLHQQPCRRTMVIFIRHFLCGNCQEYLLRLSSHPLLQRSNLLEHGVNIAIVGCGSPSHIASYRALTRLPDEWELYADPLTDLYNTLAMQRTLKLGDKRPIYIQRTLTGNMLRSIAQGVRRMPKGDVGKAGAWDVNGGEFLFEMRDDVSDWRLRWCHQMENSRDHTEVEDLISVLGLNSAPNSPAVTSVSKTPPKLHNRSQSTPLIVENDSKVDLKLAAHSRSTKRRSIRRALTARPQSWLERPKGISMSFSRRSQMIG